MLAPLDYDTLPVGSKQYVVTVTATDGGGLVVSAFLLGSFNVGGGVGENRLPLNLKKNRSKQNPALTTCFSLRRAQDR